MITYSEFLNIAEKCGFKQENKMPLIIHSNADFVRGTIAIFNPIEGVSINQPYQPDTLGWVSCTSKIKKLDFNKHKSFIWSNLENPLHIENNDEYQNRLMEINEQLKKDLKQIRLESINQL